MGDGFDGRCSDADTTHSRKVGHDMIVLLQPDLEYARIAVAPFLTQHEITSQGT